MVSKDYEIVNDITYDTKLAQVKSDFWSVMQSKRTSMTIRLTMQYEIKC